MLEQLPTALAQLGIGFIISCILIAWGFVAINIYWHIQGNRRWTKFVNKIEEFRNDFV